MKHKHRFLLLSLTLIILFVINPLCQLYSFAGELPATGSKNTLANFWLWNFLGRLHPLMVHFPVSLILLAAVMEGFTIGNFNSKLRPGINVILTIGVFSAIISVILGLLLAQSGDYGAETLAIHQWSGIITATFGFISHYLLKQASVQKKASHVKQYRASIFLAGLGVIVAGHFGASLTHGSDYLTSALPWSKNYEAVPVNKIDFASFQGSAPLTQKQQVDLSMHVKTIFAHNCYKCHGPEKVKGELRLDSKQMIFKGGENGPVIIAGDLTKSDLFRRINLPANHKEVMPNKGKKIPEADIATIKLWIEKGAPWPADAGTENQYRVAAMEPRNPALPAATANLQHPVDVWVNEYFKKNQVSWPAVVDDKIYLRRIYLDIIGLLPSSDDLQQFIQDTNPQKRQLWVRKLLNRNDDYAMHWLTFWNDALRNDYTGTGYITGGRYNINNWLYQSLQTNKPYDLFAQELISPTKASKGFIEGIKWRGVINASQRTEMQAAQNVSQVFLGLNLKCASCHNSFISDWKLDDAYGFANIFSDTTLEINRCDKPTGKYTEAKMLFKNFGNINSAATAAIKQQQLAQMMTQPEDGRFYRTIVNRIWAQLMGRGIIEPVDLMDNEPWSQDLLDWLAYNFVQNKANLKELIYVITTSKTYQLPSVGFKEPNQLYTKDYKFNGMLKRRMSGEQFADAVSYIVAPVFPDSLVMFNPFIVVPEQKTVVKKENKKQPTTKTAAQKEAEEKQAAAKKLIAKQQAEQRKEAARLLTNKLLEDKSMLLYPRASLVVNNGFLTALGRPNRETVSTSRDSQANLLQALELTNGERFNAVLKTGAENWINKYHNSDVVITEIYKKALGRQPAPKELAVAKKMIGDKPGTEAVQDLFWSVLLLPEFQIIN